jgi:hypothetical protein
MADGCTEYAKIKARMNQCKATVEYLREHSEGLAIRRGAERYEQLSEQARQECAAHVHSCPACGGRTSDWT